MNGSLVLTSEAEALPLRPQKAAQDIALVEKARGGDRLAFSQLIETHYDFIFRTACKWTGKRSDAEDVAQEVCVKLATAIRQFDGIDKVKQR